MKYIKIYESSVDWRAKREKLLNKVSYYFEDTIPISKEEGFIECLYSDAKKAPVEFYFVFKSYFDDFEILEKYLKKMRIKITNEIHDKYKSEYEINLSENKIKKLAEKMGFNAECK